MIDIYLHMHNAYLYKNEAILSTRTFLNQAPHLGPFYTGVNVQCSFGKPGSNNEILAILCINVFNNLLSCFLCNSKGKKEKP